VSSFLRIIKKFFVSAFVVVTFAAYALHERSANLDGQVNATLVTAVAMAAPAHLVPTFTPTPEITATDVPTVEIPSVVVQMVGPPTEVQAAEPPTEVPTVEVPTPEIPTVEVPTEVPTEIPTQVPPTEVPTDEATGRYKNGDYTGPEVNAVYGWVQVKAVIQDGELADVQFLDFPQDRRTSQRINSRAVPNLQTEAIQAQSADVDIISGATLTSRAFIESLQSALAMATES